MGDLALGIVGWNGRRNTGDDAMASVLVEHAVEVVDGHLDCALLADRRYLPEFEMGSAPLRVRGFSHYNLVRSLPTAVARHAVWRTLFERRFTRGLDLLILGGGSILHGGHTLRRFQGLIQRARERNPAARAGAVGVSVGPFRSEADRSACADFVPCLDFISVRDSRSTEELARMGHEGPVVQGTDLAVLLPELRGAVVRKNGTGAETLGISLRGDVLGSTEISRLGRAFAGILDRKPEIRLTLLVLCEDPRAGDEAATRALLRAIDRPGRVSVHPYSSRTSLMYDAISGCRLVVAMRLHAAVLAYATETPFMMLAYHQKGFSFAREVGLADELCCDASVVEADDLASLIEAELEGPRKPRVSMALEEGRRSARHHLELLSDAINLAAREVN